MTGSSDLNRLRWRCRRGTTELDRLLNWYLDQRYGIADGDTQSAFSSLLDEQDPTLWDWIVCGRTEFGNPYWRTIIHEIRAAHRI